MAICTSWFDTPTTLVMADHCVGRKEGRAVMDLWNGAALRSGGQYARGKRAVTRRSPGHHVVAMVAAVLLGFVVAGAGTVIGTVGGVAHPG
jgi:hypothetical protein